MLAKQFKTKKSSVPDKTPMKSGIKEKKPKQKKKKRLIVRNLAFQATEADLKKVFSAFGNVIDVKIPLKPDGRKKGFGFVEFDNTKSLIQAMKSMNYKEIKGRKVAIDFAVDKNTYQSKIQTLDKNQSGKPKPDEIAPNTKSEASSDDSSDDDEEEEDVEDEENEEEEENGEEDEDDKRLNAFLKEFDSGAEALTKSKVSEEESQVTSDSDESSDEGSDDESDEEEHEDLEIGKKRKNKDRIHQSPANKKLKKDSKDVSEGKTVFIRNVAFTTTNESLKEALEEFGECEYSLICMDPFTDHPKGTAFIKFKEKSSADKLVEDSFKEPGVIVDGRRLNCSYAISREEVALMNDAPKKPKDKRNLNLLRVGLIMLDSPESEGVSKSDMARRAQLEMTKKIRLKNVNYFVSDTRLVIHNLPRVYSDGELRKLFKNAAGQGAVVKEAKVMKEFGKTDASGNPVSKGYGFIAFTKHEDALTALNKLNNNPDIFTSQRRPIVEFAVENKVAIMSKEQRKEKIQLRNKRRTEEKNARQQLELQEKTKESSKTQKEPSNSKKKKNKSLEKKKNDMKGKNKESADSQTGSNDKSPSENKKQKKKKPRKKNKETKLANMNSKQASVSDLTNKYKDKLKNKIR